LFAELRIDTLGDLERMSYERAACFSDRGLAIGEEIRAFIWEMKETERASRSAAAGFDRLAVRGCSLPRHPIPPHGSKPSPEPIGLAPGEPAAAEVISLPEAVWQYGVDGLPISTRLLNVLRTCGCQRLGDLHGVRFADMLSLRNCGCKVVAELRALVGTAQRGELPAPSLEPGASHRLEEFVVAPAASALSPYDLPLSRGLENVLRSIDLRELGELDGIPCRDLMRLPGFARVRFQELLGLLIRAGRGEFNRPEGRFSKRRIGELLRVVEELLGTLTPRQRTILLRRFGAEDNRVWTLHELAVLCGLTREGVRQIALSCPRSIRKAGGPRLKKYLAGLAATCRRLGQPLTPQLLVQWLPADATPPRLPPEFHVRLLGALAPDLAIEVEVPPAREPHRLEAPAARRVEPAVRADYLGAKSAAGPSSRRAITVASGG
jgi:hypothetical protein